MLVLSRIVRPCVYSVSSLSRFYHKGIIGEDNIIRGDKNIEIPETDIFSFLKKKLVQHGDKVALVDGINGNQMSFNELLANSNRLASFLDKKGYNKSECLGIHSPNCIEYPIIILGALAKGMIFTTCNPLYTSDEINRQLKSSNAKILFTNSNMIETATKAIDNSNVDLLVSIDNTTINDSGVLNLSEILQNGDPDFEKELTIDPLVDVVSVMYSSGTTGLPKGVMNSHHNFIANTLQIYDRSEKESMRENILGILPMFHVYGIVYIIILHLYHGATIVTQPSFDPENFLAAIQNEKIEKLALVPPIILFMLNHPLVDKYDLSSVSAVTVAAAPLDENVVNAFIEKFPHVSLRQGYGLTESLATHLQTVDRAGQKPGSTGTAVKGIDWKIRCVKTGRALGPNEKGEICTKGPATMLGYLNNPKATADCLMDDGWLHSGDLGYYDKEGNLFVVDRLKELIKYNAFQVAPAELEDTLLGHPDILDCCVIGIPDERSGQVPRAYIVKTRDSTLTEDDVHSFFHVRLSDHKQLRGGVTFVNAVPKSASGKLLRRVLLQEYLDSQT